MRNKQTDKYIVKIIITFKNQCSRHVDKKMNTFHKHYLKESILGKDYVSYLHIRRKQST